jgi:nitrogen regulatory protein PII
VLAYADQPAISFQCHPEFTVDYAKALAERRRGQIPDEQVERAIDAIVQSASTGKIGDGKIFVFPVEQAIRIRTRESGDDAL